MTSYPEYPHLELSSPPAFDIHSQWTVLKVALKSKKETALNATESRGFARLVRAKKIFDSSKSISAKFQIMPIMIESRRASAVCKGSFCRRMRIVRFVKLF